MVIDHLMLVRRDGSKLSEENVEAAGEVRQGATIELKLHSSEEAIRATITQMDHLVITAVELTRVVANLGIAMEYDGAVRSDTSVQTEIQTEVHGDAPVPVEFLQYRPEYIQALSLLAQVCEDVIAQGCQRPVLVGGGAVEFYTGGSITSGDFDLVAAEHEVFEDVLPRYGFTVEERRHGRLMKSFLHPKLGIAVEVISGFLYPGSDATRIRPVEIAEGKRIAFLPIEDLIADRLGQCADDGRQEMLDQAIALFKLAHEPDEGYLDERIRVQTMGDWSLASLKARI